MFTQIDFTAFTAIRILEKGSPVNEECTQNDCVNEIVHNTHKGVHPSLMHVFDMYIRCVKGGSIQNMCVCVA
jgi:hypothetical protein